MTTFLRRGSLSAALILALASSPYANAATFNYHGNLTNAGAAANGRYDIRLSVYPSSTSAVPSGAPVEVYGVDVHDGAFNTAVDLGAAAQGGGWVGVAVRKAGESEFEALAGRTALAPDGTCPDAWLVAGNAGTGGAGYVGTADASDFHVGVNGNYVGNFYQNRATAFNPFGGAAVPGQYSFSSTLSNGAAGDYSVAIGYNSGTVNAGSIVIADRSSGAITDSAPDQFIVESTGGQIFNGNALRFTTDDMVVYPRATGGDDDADFTLVSRSGNFGRLFVSDSSGVLNIGATGGVHVSSPVEIDGDTSVKNIRVAGDAHMATAGGFKANSDARIKQRIEPVSDAEDTLNRLHLVTFEYSDAYLAAHPEIAPKRYYNVIAQQFEEVFPDAVSPSGEYLPGAAKSAENEIRQVDTYPAQIVTMAAVQELSHKNATLQHTVDRLLARIEKLEAAKGK